MVNYELTSHSYSQERTVMPEEYYSQRSLHDNISMSMKQSYAQLESPSQYQMPERSSIRLAVQASMQPTSNYPDMYPDAPSTPYLPTSEKHPRSPDLLDDGIPKAKKQKKKVTGESTSTKRGYTAKKRNEAAQIAAQNAQYTPLVSYTNGKGKERDHDVVPMQTIAPDGTSDSSTKLQPELQVSRCMSNRYKTDDFPRCVACTRRWAGDTCRFQGIRFFLKNEQRQIVGVSFMESQRADFPNMKFPEKWNVPLTDEHLRKTKRTTAKALVEVLRQELAHMQVPEIIHRHRETEVRVTCDTCMTSLFCGSWMCRLCGREACPECFATVKDLTYHEPNATEQELTALQAKRDRHSHSNPFFLACLRRNEHTAADFSPVSRFCREELSEAILGMEATIREAEDSDASTPELVNSDSSVTSESSGIQTPPPSTPTGVPVPKESLSATSDAIPSHEIRRYVNNQLSEEIFRSLWHLGEPLLVSDLLQNFKIQWTPEYFMQKYGDQSCLIIECQTDSNRRVTVKDFFKDFGNYEGRNESWKLKDWPPSTDFKTAFPELYEDFSQAVPVPNYVRRDGAMNIASHFPLNTVSPDLGPKMYNAMASFEMAGSKGSTRLHMDMSDALNIMTYASPTRDGSPGTAAWDLFKAEDSDKIRAFLKEKFRGQYLHDPIHSQQFYLDEHLRRELWEKWDVYSYRVYQRPGEAIFIPAGCAHQVCNLADIVKVAIDFVSPENIGRCEKLTREFREQNQGSVWKEDVLQLRTMMWFAWLSCNRMEFRK